MKTWMTRGMVGALALAMWFGCGRPGSDDRGAGPVAGTDSVELFVNIDGGLLDVGLDGLSQITAMTGHTVEIKNGPAGCAWDAGTSTLTCEILFRNLAAADLCMTNVRTRLHSSTNPSAMVNGADYIWNGGPNPEVVPNSSLPINESGYCITEVNPSAAGSVEGCENTWQDNIPPGAIATQYFAFTNVPAGQYTVWLQIMADYYVCSAPDGMALIPAGCFDMGDHFNEGENWELPVHNVCITSDFYMDRHEVTNAEYAVCVDAGGCTAPDGSGSYSRDSYYDNPAYNNFPVIFVNWDQATAYCAWAGKRLPTEAEWEYTARGGLAGKRYPLGDSISGVDANYRDSGDPWDNDTSPIGYYARNGYGLYDMAGNVWEWVNDWFQYDYYSFTQNNDPPGPPSGTSRVMRGGCWLDGTYYLRVSTRFSNYPTDLDYYLGFRCAGEKYNWTWISGSDEGDQYGVYGTKGVADQANAPGGRAGAVSWTDAAGDFWLFGGYGYAATGSEGWLNDLWRWDGENWTWISGSDATGQLGVYGTKGAPDPDNVPGSRSRAVSWIDAAGDLWLFGGNGFDSVGISFSYLNDLWRWDGTNWTWISGSDISGQRGVYGTKGTPDPDNVPGARWAAVSWIDSAGDLWLFGGYGFDEIGPGFLNDLWRWDGTNWTWISGSDITEQSGVYGTKGVPDPDNVPGARWYSVSWIDASGDLWLFGGVGRDEYGDAGYLNDLWRWDGVNWTWISGSNTTEDEGVYGDKGVPHPDNVPPGRAAAVSWLDADGNFWVFGGGGIYEDHNDLWRWDGANWTWMRGSSDLWIPQEGVYGTKGVPHPSNVPGARSGAVSWIDNAGDLWLFGGRYSWEPFFNDLWRFGQWSP